MSLARALTTRRKTSDPPNPAYLGRAASQRAPNAKPIKRNEISLPVALISTTNVLSYEAPDIPNAPNVRDRGGRYFTPSSAISIGSSHNSEDSDNTASDHSHETDATSVDLSSPETSHEQFNHFGSKTLPKSSGTFRSVRSNVSSLGGHSASLSQTSSRPSLDESPRVPTRAPSHSKSAHVLSHKRSVHRVARSSAETDASPPPRLSARRHDSIDMFNAAAINAHLPASTPAPATATSSGLAAARTRSTVNAAAPPVSTSHPFGKELEQLNEAAAEFGHAVRNAEADADFAAMRSKGLVRFCAAEYLDEIASLPSSPYTDDAAPYHHLHEQQQPMVWI